MNGRVEKGKDKKKNMRTSMLTLSMTSKKTSFFLYLIPSVRHETAFVTAIGGRAWISSLWDSCVIYLRDRMVDQRANWTRQIQHVLLQNLALRGLWISKVHHLIHKLVYNNKIIPDTLLLEFFEIFNEDGDKSMEENDDFGGICVSLGNS